MGLTFEIGSRTIEQLPSAAEVFARSGIVLQQTVLLERTFAATDHHDAQNETLTGTLMRAPDGSPYALIGGVQLEARNGEPVEKPHPDVVIDIHDPKVTYSAQPLADRQSGNGR